MEVERFVQAPSGRFAMGCATIFLGMPAFGITMQILRSESRWALPLPSIGFALVLLWVYLRFNEELSVTIDDRGMRLSRSKVLFGRRGQERVEWEIPLAALTFAREVTKKTPAERGGWNVKTVLQLPQGRTIDASLLGGAEDSSSAYSRLARHLGKRLGRGFERMAPMV